MASGASQPSPAWVTEDGRGPKPFAIPAATLALMVAEKDAEALQAYGGVVGVAQQLHSDPNTGLPDDARTRRRREKHYGRNVAPPPPVLGPCLRRHADAGAALLMALIIVYVPLSLVLTDPVDPRERWGYYEGGASLVLAGGGWLFLFLLDLLASAFVLNAYRRSKEKDVIVIRGGKKAIVPSSTLLVGDVLHIRGGQSLPADCLLLSSQDLRVDESPLTGERTAPTKDELDDPFLIHKTLVLQGFGTALVVAVGAHLRASGHDGRDQPLAVGPLHRQVDGVVRRLRWLSMAGPFVLFVTLAVKQGILMLIAATPSSVLPFLRHALICLALGLAIAPSRLAWTLCTAYSLQAMLRAQCAVRDERTCEGLAAVRSVVCNQAVVLQHNALAVAEGWIAGHRFVMGDFHDGVSRDDVAVIRAGAQGVMGEAVVKTVCEALAMNSVVTCAADPDHTLRGTADDGTEEALLAFLLAVGHDPVALQLAQPAEDARCFQFLTTKRRMTTVVKREQGFTVHVKGSSEVLFAECTHFLAGDGRPRPLSLEDRRQVMNFLSLLARKGYRTVVSATAADIAWDAMPQDEPLGLDYTLTGVFGLAAPNSADVAPTLAECELAGLAVRAVSSEGPELATAIAQRCGLVAEGAAGATLRGFDFRRLLEGRPLQLLALLPQLRLLPRCGAAQRKALVELLGRHSPAVAVVGDDREDVAAVAAGAVGVALRSADEAVGDRAGLLLRDGRLATLLVGLRWSRGLRHTVREALQFACTASATIFIVTFVGACCFRLSLAPLSPVNLLWLHAVLNPLALLGLSLQGPPAGTLQAGPVADTEPLFTVRMLFFVFCVAGCQVTSLLVLLFLGATWFRCVGCSPSEQDATGFCLLGRQHRTLLFNTFVWMQVLGLCWAPRRCSTAALLGCLPRLGAISVLATVQAIIVHYAGNYLDLTPLTPLQWLGSVAFAGPVLLGAPFAHAVPLPGTRPAAVPAPPTAPLPIPGPDPDVLLQSICRELALLRQTPVGDLEGVSNGLTPSPSKIHAAKERAAAAAAAAATAAATNAEPPTLERPPAVVLLPEEAAEVSFTQAYPPDPEGPESFALSTLAIASPPPRPPSLSSLPEGTPGLSTPSGPTPAPPPPAPPPPLAPDLLGLTAGPAPRQEAIPDVQRQQYLKALRTLEAEMGELNDALSVFSTKQTARLAGVLPSSQASSLPAALLSPASLMEQTLWPDVAGAAADPATAPLLPEAEAEPALWPAQGLWAPEATAAPTPPDAPPRRPSAG